MAMLATYRSQSKMAMRVMSVSNAGRCACHQPRRHTLQIARRAGVHNRWKTDLASTASTSTSTTSIAAKAAVTSLPEKLDKGWTAQLQESYWVISKLSKFKLSSLVVFTTSAGFLMAPGPIAWVPLATVSIGTALAACSANTFNQIYERDIDKLMKRTQNRPLPSRRVTPASATAWAVTSGALGVGLLAVGNNLLTAGLGASTIALYAAVYTPLKVRTEWNTHVGSIVGAIPPVMGWTAATGSLMAFEPVLLGSLLFLWQMPHFFALSWRSRVDYAAGGFRMVACADPTGQRSANLSLKYAAFMMPLPIIASMTDVTTWMFAVEGLAANSILGYYAWKFNQKPGNGRAQKVFLCTLWYLPVLMAGMIFHKTNWSDQKKEKNQFKNPLITDETNQKIADGVAATRKTMIAACPHEVLTSLGINPGDYSGKSGSDDTAHSEDTIGSDGASNKSSESTEAFCPMTLLRKLSGRGGGGNSSGAVGTAV